MRVTAVPLVVGVLLSACSGLGSTSHAERVDVPVTVQIRLAGHSKLCSKVTCWIHFSAVVTTDSKRGIYARDCSVRALDRAGRVVAEGGAALGFPAGAYTRVGEPYRMMGGTQVRLVGERPVRLDSLEATCSAYVWHGEVPI
jgi:hypothetical protein